MGKSPFFFKIVINCGVPIYRQLIDQVHTGIAAGPLAPGVFLPSIRQVAKDLNIDPMTVSKAYSILSREGITENVRGKGIRIISSSISVGHLKNRKKALSPLLEQLINSAQQFSLAPDEVMEMLQNKWKKKT